MSALHWAALVLAPLPASSLTSLNAAPLQARRSQPSAARHRRNESYCGLGKLLPELYVLGVKNSATTSLYQDLHDRGVLAAPRDEEKEWLFFHRATSLPPILQEAAWLGSLPSCPSERQLLADFSPTYLYTVPLPEDLQWSPSWGFPAKKNTDESAWDTARLMRRFHQTAGVPQPKLLVMLREPLERLQSDYYHSAPKGSCLGCKANGTFADSFAFNTELFAQKPPVVTDWFWRSLYSRQLETFLEQFDAAQFMIVPNREYIGENSRAFSESLLAWLGVDAEPWSEASHENLHIARPPLNSELPLDAPARKTFEAAIAPENARLVRTIARAQLQGALLAGYQGPRGSEEGIRSWLERNW